MPIDTEILQSLADRLSQPGAFTIRDEERSVLAAALMELARAHSVIARQEQFLALDDQSREEIERISRDAIAAVAPAASEDPARAFDFDAAQAARDRLLGAIEDASTGRGVIAAALSFARDIAIIVK